MEKEKVVNHFEVLQDMYNEFSQNEREYKNGRNKGDRGKAEKTLEVILFRFESYVTSNPELYLFITSEGMTDYERAIIWDEFISFKYFSKDLKNTLTKLESQLT